MNRTAATKTSGYTLAHTGCTTCTTLALTARETAQTEGRDTYTKHRLSGNGHNHRGTWTK